MSKYVQSANEFTLVTEQAVLPTTAVSRWVAESRLFPGALKTMYVMFMAIIQRISRYKGPVLKVLDSPPVKASARINKPTTVDTEASPSGSIGDALIHPLNPQDQQDSAIKFASGVRC